MDLTAFKYIRNQRPNFYVGKNPLDWNSYNGPADDAKEFLEYQKTLPQNQNFNQTPIQQTPQTPQGPQEKGPKGPSAFKTNLKNANYGAMVQQGIAFAGNLINAYKQPVANQSQLLSNAGTSQGMINGIGYDIQNGIDEDAELANLKAQTSGNTMKTIGSGAGAGAANDGPGGPGKGRGPDLRRGGGLHGAVLPG